MSEELSEIAAKANRAQLLLDNDLYKEAHAELEKQLIDAWIKTPPRDSDGRERCWAAVQANRKHRDYLQSIVNNGKLAAAELKALADSEERKSRFRII